MKNKFLKTLILGACAIVSVAPAKVKGSMNPAGNMYSAMRASEAAISSTPAFKKLYAQALNAPSVGQTASSYLKDHPISIPGPVPIPIGLTPNALANQAAQYSVRFNDALYSQHPALWTAMQYADRHGDTSLKDIFAGPANYNPYDPTISKSTLLMNQNGPAGWWVLQPHSSGGAKFIERGTYTPIPYGIATGASSFGRTNSTAGISTWVEHPFTDPAPTWKNHNASWIATWLTAHEGLYNPKKNLFYAANTARAFSKYPGYQAASILERYDHHMKYRDQVFQNAWEFWLVDAEIQQHLLTPKAGEKTLKKFIANEEYTASLFVLETEREEQKLEKCGMTCQIMNALSESFSENW